MTVAFIVVLVIALILFAAVLLLSHGVRVERYTTTASYYTTHAGGRDIEAESFPAERIEITVGPWYFEFVRGRWLA